ncbi:MAG: sialate O-acetylesterase, partial [Duncaniella dubosii]|nr:sialate O-acetylesterase [Duncaniella dubosii]
MAEAEVKMPAFFGDNMVMQQNTDANMWGTAKASSTVTVTPGWTSEVYKTKAGKDGKWKISIPTPAAGGPYTVTVSDGTPLT